jgi:hypothetical protein
MVNSQSGNAVAGWRGEHVPSRPLEPRTDLTGADAQMILALIPLTAAAVVTSDPFVIGLWQVGLVAVALIVVGAAPGQTACRRSQARQLARRQSSPAISALPGGRRPR